MLINTIIRCFCNTKGEGVLNFCFEEKLSSRKIENKKVGFKIDSRYFFVSDLMLSEILSEF